MADDRPFDRVMDDLRRGDPDAAREVFTRYARRLIGLAAARLPAPARPRVDPEDVAQSVFRTFFRRQAAGQFAPEHWDALWSLLAVMTVRKCGHRVEHLLAARRDARRDTPTAGGPDASSLHIPDPAPTPEEALLLEETLAHVLDGLHPRERPVVLLRLQGFTVPEISKEVGRSERTVLRVLDGVRDRLTADARAG